MRLRQLDLIRYGKFHEQVLDFGPAGRDRDVTVVFGENEAGKSTAFSAWLDLLFGLPMQTAHAFRFDRKDMMVGATIEAGGEALTLRRTGKRQESLTDENGRAVAEGRLTALLHGLDRDSYAKRFSLNDAVLREGGEEIARAEGDLGRLLHAGTSGLSGISDVMAAVEAEVDGFHKKSGRATTLAKARTALRDLEEAAQAARLEPRRFADLRKAQAEAARDLTAAKAACDAARRAVILREAAERRRSIAAEIAQAQARLAQAPAGPDLPEDAVGRVVAADERRIAAEQRRAEASAQIARLERDLATLESDAAGLRVGAALAALEEARFDDGELLLPRVQTAAADIGRRRADATRLTAQAAALAERIAGRGVPAEEVALSSAHRGDLRAAAQAVRDAARQIDDLDRSRQEAQAALGPEVAVPRGLEALRDALMAVQRDPSDPDARQTEAERAAGLAARAAAGLPEGWRDLALAGLPEDALLADLAQRTLRAATRVEEAQNQLKDAEEALAEAGSAHGAVQAGGGTVTDDAIAQSRAARDTAWSEHVAMLEAESAARFAALMHTDDGLRARHAASAEARLHLANLAQQVHQAEHRATRRRADLEAAEAARAALAGEAAAIAARLGLAADSPAAGFGARRGVLATALDRALEAEGAMQQAARTAARRATLLARLKDAMQDAMQDAAPGTVEDAGEGAGWQESTGAQDASLSPDRILPAAERMLAGLDRIAQAAQARQAASASLATLTQAREAAAQALQAHEAALARLTSDGWAKGLEAEAILTRLPDLETLAQIESERSTLARRIARMEAALAAFEATMQPLRAPLGLTTTAEVSETLMVARQRAADAAALQARIGALGEELLAARQAEGAAQVALAASAAEIASVLEGQADVPDVAPREHVGALAARDQMRAALARLNEEHARAAGDLEPQALAAEEQDTDPARLARLGAELAEAEAQRDAVLRRSGEADEALRQAMASGGGAEIDQRRATALESLREEARLAATKLLGLMAAQGALRRFRQERRGDMLTATEAAFARLTHGEWPRLETRTTGKSERLVALRDGEPVTAEGMSTGTRGQLYLALRIAGHADFVARNGALPFVTDDIHETFDDPRARAALELAGEMGQIGQAILFTHHRHLVDLARDVLGDVRVIELTK